MDENYSLWIIFTHYKEYYSIWIIGQYYSLLIKSTVYGEILRFFENTTQFGQCIQSYSLWIKYALSGKLLQITENTTQFRQCIQSYTCPITNSVQSQTSANSIGNCGATVSEYPIHVNCTPWATSWLCIDTFNDVLLTSNINNDELFALFESWRCDLSPLFVPSRVGNWFPSEVVVKHMVGHTAVMGHMWTVDHNMLGDVVVMYNRTVLTACPVAVDHMVSYRWRNLCRRLSQNTCWSTQPWNLNDLL